MTRLSPLLIGVQLIPNYMVLVHLYCLRHFYIEIIVKMANHFIPASLPTRKASELQKLMARQSKDHVITYTNNTA